MSKVEDLVRQLVEVAQEEALEKVRAEAQAILARVLGSAPVPSRSRDAERFATSIASCRAATVRAKTTVTWKGKQVSPETAARFRRQGLKKARAALAAKRAQAKKPAKKGRR